MPRNDNSRNRSENSVLGSPNWADLIGLIGFCSSFIGLYSINPPYAYMGGGLILMVIAL